MSNKDDKNPFMLLLAGISLLADVLTLLQFISTGNLFLFWSFQWIASIVFIFGFFWAGVGFLRLGNRSENAELVMGLFGIGYIIASLLVFIFFCIQQTMGGLAIDKYVGFVFLLGIPFLFGTVAVILVNAKLLIYPSYGYGLVSLLFAISLVIKYVFSGHPFYWSGFIGEIPLLIAGTSIFIYFYKSSTTNP